MESQLNQHQAEWTWIKAQIDDSRSEFDYNNGSYNNALRKNIAIKASKLTKFKLNQFGFAYIT